MRTDRQQASQHPQTKGIPTLITLATYKKGTNAAHVQYNPQTKQVFVMHEDKNGHSQFPTMYDDGRIAYDRVPVKYIRPAIEKAFRAKKALEFSQRNAGWHTFAACESDVIHDLQAAGMVVVFESGNQFMIV
jgi:hypothetical protein